MLALGAEDGPLKETNERVGGPLSLLVFKEDGMGHVGNLQYMRIGAGDESTAPALWIS